MTTNQHNDQRKHRTPLFWILLALLLVALAVSGVSAYLSMSSQQANRNVTTAPYPEVTVNGTTVTVNPNGYSVYLRVAVTVNWRSGDSILAEIPVAGTDYTLPASNTWKKIDGFYYYKMPITEPIDLTILTVRNTAQKNGYTLDPIITAQVIQAVGSTDADNTPAVQDAWGVTPEQITAP